MNGFFEPVAVTATVGRRSLKIATMAAATNGDGDGLSVFIICRRLYSRKGCCCNRRKNRASVVPPPYSVLFFAARCVGPVSTRVASKRKEAGRGGADEEGPKFHKAKERTARLEGREDLRAYMYCDPYLYIPHTAGTHTTTAQSSFFLESYLWRENSRRCCCEEATTITWQHNPHAQMLRSEEKHKTSDERRARAQAKLESFGPGGRVGSPQQKQVTTNLHVFLSHIRSENSLVPRCNQAVMSNDDELSRHRALVKS